jgi:hypothetical protein
MFNDGFGGHVIRFGVLVGGSTLRSGELDGDRYG